MLRLIQPMLGIIPKVSVLLCLAFTLPTIGQNIATLEIGRPVERELKGGETHTYSVSLLAGQFLYVVADQNRCDVILTLVGPGGDKLVEVNSPNGTQAPESIGYLADADGSYQLLVRSAKKDALTRRYNVRISELRAATADDKIFVEGQKLKVEGDLLTGDRDDDAFERYQAAAKLFRLINDDKKKASLIHQIGVILDDSLNRPEKAIEFYDEALALFESVNSGEEANQVLINKGIAYENLLRYDDAIAAYQKALEIAVSINDKSVQAKTYNQLGRGHARLGDFARSLEDFKQALKLNEGAPWTRQKSVTLMGLGNVYGWFGNDARGLEYQLMNVKLLEENGAFGEIPAQLLNIGNSYLDQDCSVSMEYFQRAYAGFVANKAQVGTAYGLNNIGIAYACQGQYAQALNYLVRSQTLKTAFMPKDPGSLSDIGWVYRLQGKYPEALEYYQKSLDMYLEIKGFDFASRAMEAMSEIYYLQGNYAKSLEFANRSLEIAQRFGYAKVWKSLTKIGYARRALGDKKEAREALEAAIKKIESLRSNSIGADTDRRTFEGMTGPYQLLVDLSISDGKVFEGLSYSERFKARTLLDVLQTGKIDVTKAMTAEEQKEESRFRTEIAILNTQIANVNEKTRLDELNIELQRKRISFEQFQARLFLSHPELKIQRGEMKPIALDEASMLLGDVKSGMLEFVVSDDKAFAFVITKDIGNKPTLRAYPLEVKQKDLVERIEKYQSALAAGSLDIRKQACELYDLLLMPAQAQLAGKTNLVIVPDGPLWDLPFQALMDENGKYLAEKMAVSYAPSLTALREMQKKARERTPSKDAELVAFGNPTVAAETEKRVGQVFMDEKLEPLPEAERLVNTLAKMYGPQRSRIYTGAAAREETAKQEAPKYRIVQFATHGILNDISPMYSHLVLAQDEKAPNEDGLLEAWELKDLDLKAEMVILSACDTARGKISNGEGIIGMTWAAFIAGAPTTVASQWKVESSSTTELMLEFHRQLLSGKVSKAEALRRAQLKLMRNPKYKHPSYWAAWVIVGDAS